jgi:16S rRNA (uracil1498-N3)-methyltransferase
VDLKELLSRTEPGFLNLFLYENKASIVFKQVAKTVKPHEGVLLVVGPEGGFTAAEADAARAHGFYMISLGKRILRAETAAIIALGIAQYEWGDMDG